MAEKNIHKLLKMCDDYFLQSRHCYSYVHHCKNTWQKGILAFMNELHIEDYSPDIGERYLMSDRSADLVRRYPRVMRRGIHMLDDLVTLGCIRRRSYIKIVHPLEGELGLLAEDFLKDFQKMPKSQHTVDNYRRHLSRLIRYLNDNGVICVEEMDESHLISYIDSIQIEKRVATMVIKGFLRFLKQQKFIKENFDFFIEGFKARDKTRLPSFYSEAEVLKIEPCVNRNTPVGKRNYAIVLLASRLGLRSADIAGLEFSHLNWRNSKISLSTQKTGKTIELPILPEVGNALIDYLKHGRPISTSQKVFLLAKAPFCEITSMIVGNVIQATMRKSGVDTTRRKHGPHALRHSLATNMLRLGGTIPVISEVLGHQSTDTTNVYLKIDYQSLLRCVMPVPEVSKAFYEQNTEKGGRFYE